MVRIEATPTGRGLVEPDGSAKGLGTVVDGVRTQPFHVCLTCQHAMRQKRGIAVTISTMCRLLMQHTTEMVYCEAYEERPSE